MNDPATRKVSGWKIAGLLVGALVLCVAILWIVLSVIGTAKLERMLGAFADDAAAALRIGVALQILRMYEISGDTLQTLP